MGEPTALGEDALTGADSGSSGQSLLKRIAIYIPGSVIPSVLALATSIIFTRIFSPVEFGKYSLFLVYAAPIELLAVAWLDQSIGKFLAQEQTSEGRRRVKDAVFLSMGLIFFIEIVLGVAFFAVGTFLLAPGWRSFLLPTFLFVIVSSLFDVLIIVFAVEARAKEYTSYRLLDGVVTFGSRLLLVSAIFSMDIRLMFWSVIISHCFILPVMWVRGGFPVPQRIVRVLRSSEARGAARAFVVFGLPMTIFFFSSVLLDVGDRYVLNFLEGPGPVGVYDANYRLIAGLAPLMMVPITITLHPYLMRIAGSGQTEHVGQVIGDVIENLLLVGILTVGLTFLLHAVIARVLLGGQFRAGSVIMPAVVAGVFLFNIGTFAHKPFEIVGRTRVMLLFALIAAAANVVFCFALIPLVGLVGAGYATFLSYALYTVCVGYLGRRIFRWRVNLRRLVTQGGIIIGGVAAIYVVRDAMSGLGYGWSLAVTIAASCVLASVSLLAILRPMLTSGWPMSRAEPRRPVRASPRDFLRRPQRHRPREVARSGSPVIPPESETATGTTPAASPAADCADTLTNPGCSPPPLARDERTVPWSAPSRAPNGTRPSPDAGISRSPSEFIAKVRDVVGLYLNPPEHTLALAVDEKSQIRALDRTAPCLPIRPTTPTRVTHDYVRSGKSGLFAGYDVGSGSVIALHSRKHRQQEFLRFLKLIDQAVPEDLDLHLVLDNYATHGTPEIRKWLLRHPRFHLHFTLTSSSWLNLVESWLGELTTRKLRRSAHQSVTELEGDIRKWINERNKDPKPFIWIKKADHILETLAAYAQRINDARH